MGMSDKLPACRTYSKVLLTVARGRVYFEASPQ
jgi:hypothetical protein